MKRGQTPVIKDGEYESTVYWCDAELPGYRLMFATVVECDENGHPSLLRLHPGEEIRVTEGETRLEGIFVRDTMFDPFPLGSGE